MLIVDASGTVGSSDDAGRITLFLYVAHYLLGILARSLDKIGLPFQVEYSRFVQWRFLEHSACNLFLGRNPAKT